MLLNGSFNEGELIVKESPLPESALSLAKEGNEEEVIES